MQFGEVRLARFRAQAGEFGNAHADGILPFRLRIRECLQTFCGDGGHGLGLLRRCSPAMRGRHGSGSLRCRQALENPSGSTRAATMLLTDATLLTDVALLNPCD